jgi:hypothetical protein
VTAKRQKRRRYRYLPYRSFWLQLSTNADRADRRQGADGAPFVLRDLRERLKFCVFFVLWASSAFQVAKNRNPGRARESHLLGPTLLLLRAWGESRHAGVRKPVRTVTDNRALSASLLARGIIEPSVRDRADAAAAVMRAYVTRCDHLHAGPALASWMSVAESQWLRWIWRNRTPG